MKPTSDKPVSVGVDGIGDCLNVGVGSFGSDGIDRGVGGVVGAIVIPIVGCIGVPLVPPIVVVRDGFCQVNGIEGVVGDVGEVGEVVFHWVLGLWPCVDVPKVRDFFGEDNIAFFVFLAWYKKPTCKPVGRDIEHDTLAFKAFLCIGDA